MNPEDVYTGFVSLAGLWEKLEGVCKFFFFFLTLHRGFDVRGLGCSPTSDDAGVVTVELVLGIVENFGVAVEI